VANGIVTKLCCLLRVASAERKAFLELDIAQNDELIIRTRHRARQINWENRITARMILSCPGDDLFFSLRVSSTFEGLGYAKMKTILFITPCIQWCSAIELCEVQNTSPSLFVVSDDVYLDFL
jgi:hypothetical protein